MASTNNGNWSAFGNNRNKTGSGPRPNTNRGFPSAFGGQRGGQANPQRSQRRTHDDYYEQRDRQRAEEAKRKEEQEARSRELNDVNFPSLGSSFAAGGPSSGHTWTKQGSQLAKAWSEATEEQQMIEKMRREREERKQYQSHGLSFPLPVRRVVARDNYYEEEEEQEEEETRPSAGNSILGSDGSDWTMVDRSKIKKNTTGIWKKVDPEPAQDSVWGNDEEQANDDSVW